MLFYFYVGLDLYIFGFDFDLKFQNKLVVENGC